MRNRWLGGFWGQIPLAATITGLQALAFTTNNFWIIPALLMVWIVTVGRITRPGWDKPLGLPARWLRKRPILFWLVLLSLFVIGVSAWLVDYQPTNGRALMPVEVCYTLLLLWVFLYILAYGLDRTEARLIGGKLA